MNIGIIIASIVISAVIFFFIGVAYRKKIAESKKMCIRDRFKGILLATILELSSSKSINTETVSPIVTDFFVYVGRSFK